MDLDFHFNSHKSFQCDFLQPFMCRKAFIGGFSTNGVPRLSQHQTNYDAVVIIINFDLYS